MLLSGWLPFFLRISNSSKCVRLFRTVPIIMGTSIIFMFHSFLSCKLRIFIPPTHTHTYPLSFSFILTCWKSEILYLPNILQRMANMIGEGTKVPSAHNQWIELAHFHLASKNIRSIRAVPKKCSLLQWPSLDIRHNLLMPSRKSSTYDAQGANNNQDDFQSFLVTKICPLPILFYEFHNRYREVFTG